MLKLCLTYVFLRKICAKLVNLGHSLKNIIA